MKLQPLRYSAVSYYRLTFPRKEHISTNNVCLLQVSLRGSESLFVASVIFFFWETGSAQ